MSAPRSPGVLRRTLTTALVAALAVSALALQPTVVQAAGPTTYYISNATGSGCSDLVAVPTATTPWCSLSKANRTYAPGDQILLGRGSAWNGQQMVLAGQGTAASPIMVGTFGSGSLPRPRLSLQSLGKAGYADKTIIRLQNPSHWAVSGLELSYAASGVLAQYRSSFTTGSYKGNEGLEFSDLLVHHIAGIRGGIPGGDGVNYSEHCTGTAGHLQDLDLWQGGAISISGAYGDPLSSSEYFVRDVSIHDIEGHNNENVVNIDPCDARVGDPLHPKPAAPNLVQDVLVNNVWAYEGDGGEFTSEGHCGEGMRFAGVTNLRLINSRMQGLGACYVSSGTAAIILVSVSNAWIANNTITDVPQTGSPDQTAIDHEIYVEDVTLYNNLIARNAGPALEYLSLRGGISDYNDGHRVEGNTFFGNHDASLHRKNCCGQAYLFTGASVNNVSTDLEFAEPADQFTPWYGGWNLGPVVGPALGELPRYAADQFGSVDGASNWNYETSADGGATFQAATFQSGVHVSGVWAGGGTRGSIAAFEQTSGTCAACVSARTWTAPHAGTIAIRSRAAKSVTGGAAATASILQNTTVQASMALGADNVLGDDLNPTLTVKAGDRVRFAVSHPAGSTPTATDWVSWAPSITYVDPAGVSTGGDVAQGMFASPNLTSGFLFAPAGSAWAFSPTDAATQAAGIAENGSAYNNPNAPAGAGTQVGFIQRKGWVSQSVSGLSAGIPYTVQFTHANRSSATPQTLEVLVDGVSRGTVTPTAGTWNTFTSPSFLGSPGPHLVQIRGTATVDATAFVTQVKIVAAPAVPPLINSGFESPTVTAPSGWSYGSSLTGTAWTFAGNTGIFRSQNTWASRAVPQGSQGAFIQGAGTITSSPVPPGTYALVLSAAQRSAGLGGQTVRIKAGSSVVGLITPSDEFWRDYATASFTVPVGGAALTLEGVVGGDHALAVDDVRIVPAVTPVAKTPGEASFEQPVLAAGTHQYAPAAAPWVFNATDDNGGSGVSRNGDYFLSGLTVPDGQQVGFLQRSAVITESGYLPPGGTYSVSFQSVQRHSVNTKGQWMRVEVDGNAVLYFAPGDVWSTSRFVVTVPADGQGRLTFVGLTSGTDETALIDKITVDSLQP